MTFIRLGKAREATTGSAEDYKAAVRKYMEAMGYAQTTDSSVEGHLADMVFLPPADRPWPHEVWVEAKATALSLSDRDLISEVRSYLSSWLLRQPEARFKLMVFIENVRNPT